MQEKEELFFKLMNNCDLNACQTIFYTQTHGIYNGIIVLAYNSVVYIGISRGISFNPRAEQSTVVRSQ